MLYNLRVSDNHHIYITGFFWHVREYVWFGFVYYGLKSQPLMYTCIGIPHVYGWVYSLNLKKKLNSG